MGTFGRIGMQINQLDAVISRLGFRYIHDQQLIQPLWGGYGELIRVQVDDTSLIVKHIQLPKPEHHPRGWNSDLSHQRKLHSYQVELRWYQQYAVNCGVNCRVPGPLLVEQQGEQLLLVMEDLAQAGFARTSQQASDTQRSACLRWLACFHALHMGNSGNGLWPTGTYWHLATRPEELEALVDQELKQAADKLDTILTHAPFQTLVHGDAKLANFCFTADDSEAAAVDFQYVGRGCAMKDVALFISSAVDPDQCQQLEQSLLDEYFHYLAQALATYQPKISSAQVITTLRPLYAIAWADFQRFLKGWCPDHWKINPYSEQLTQSALVKLADYPD
ncbi:phosphotransferase [Vibrio sp.]|uniref:phosphotransferase n=1 Tax=Vibrio sp. TaxID=678 RepID=UPI003D149A41